MLGGGLMLTLVGETGAGTEDDTGGIGAQ